MVDLGTSLVQWVKSTQLNKNNLSAKCYNITDLSDGILLYELMNKVSPDHFDMECISVDVKNNWALKLGNLRRLKKALDSYLESELKISNTKFDRIDLPSLARKSQPEDMIRLFESILYAVLNCPSKDLYIKRIMELEETVQVQLMFFIQRLMVDEDNPVQDSELMKKEYEMLKNEKKKLAKQVVDLEQELNSAVEEKVRISTTLDQLKDENEKLYQDISRKSVQEERISSVFVNELKVRLNEKDESINQMQRSFDGVKKKYENEIAQLKDDLDIAQAKIYQNMNADKTLQQYKKRLESLAGIKQKAEDLQRQNENLMETVNSQLSQIENLSAFKKQVVILKEQVTKEKNRADTLSFNLESKDKTIKKYEKEVVDYRQKISILESKNQELMLDLQDSSHNSEESVGLQMDRRLPSICPIAPIKLPEVFARKSIMPSSHEQIELAMIELKQQKTITEEKKQKIKEFKERLRMCQEEMESRCYSFQGIITQLEQNNLILSDQIQVINENLAERENDRVVHEQTMYELEEVNNAKFGLLNDVKALNLEKETINKKFIEVKEELVAVQSLVTRKDGMIKELELDIKLLNEKIQAAEEKEKVYNTEINNLRKNSISDPESQGTMDLERQLIALKSENSELKQRLEETKQRIKDSLKTKDETIEKLQTEIQKNKEKFDEELETKTKEIMAESEEAMKELFKQREQLAAKLQFERRNTMIGWQRAMSIRDPGLLISDEIFKLRETLVEKEKEIARVSKNNKELKMCWKDSAKLLKAVWKQLGDETKKIEDAVKKRHH